MFFENEERIIMKIIRTIFSIVVITLCACAPNPDNANAGAQSSQDQPSNTDRDIENRDTSGSYNGRDSISNEAPNNGDTNPHQDIQGQTGTNQTGQGKK